MTTETQNSAATTTTNNHHHNTAARRPGRTVLVIGGTGLVGAPIVEELNRAGWTVRVSSRNAAGARQRFAAAVELVNADASDAEQLRRAMDGCQVALICVSDLLDPYLDLRVTGNVVQLAPQLGLQRIGLISGPSVAEERRSFPMIDAKFQAEELLKGSGVPFVIIRPSWPMESLARFVRDGRAAVLGQQPATIHPLAGSDIGRMVARALELRQTRGKTLTLHGPEGSTMTEWLTDYCALAHPGVAVKNVPFWVLSLVAALTRNTTLAAAVKLMKYFDKLPEFGDCTEANRLLGAPQTTLEQWVAQQQRDATAAAA